jgi:hypothetical protein
MEGHLRGIIGQVTEQIVKRAREVCLSDERSRVLWVAFLREPRNAAPAMALLKSQPRLLKS